MDFTDIDKKYTVIEPLKKGGQKVVYKISHPQHGVCVLKVGAASSHQSLERIRREVKTLQEIQSEYYPRLLAYEEHSDFRFSIIEEYVNSIPLSQCLKNFTAPLSLIRLTYEMTVGLNILWDKNIVHRDVKPDNVLICDGNKPRIIDLGIARLLNEDSLTKTYGYQPLTPVYAAPEQLTNNKRAIDYRTDQFNLGIIFLQLLNHGNHPFDPVLLKNGENIPDNIINNRWSKDIFDIKENHILKPVAEKLLAPQPYLRYKQINQLLNDLKMLERAYT